jgi:hypothetical protein
MRIRGLIAVLALTSLTACAASLPVRDFRTDYDRAKSRQSVTVAGYPPFRVLELREQRRIKVEVNVLHQAFGGLVNPLILLSVTDGIRRCRCIRRRLRPIWPTRGGQAARSSRSRSRRTGAPSNSAIPVRAARNACQRPRVRAGACHASHDSDRDAVNRIARTGVGLDGAGRRSRLRPQFASAATLRPPSHGKTLPASAVGQLDGRGHRP